MAQVILNTLTAKKQATKFSSSNLKKNVESKLYHIETSKTRGQSVYHKNSKNWDT